MARMSEADRWILINAIATREGTAQEISERYGRSLKFLASFVEKHRKEIEDTCLDQQIKQNLARHESTSDTTPSPIDLETLWIADKTQRLKRMQIVADMLFADCVAGGMDAAALREFRSYCASAANELGQLLHRGAGDNGTDVLNVDIQGINLENLR